MQPNTSDPLDSDDLAESDEVAEVLAALRALADIAHLTSGGYLGTDAA